MSSTTNDSGAPALTPPYAAAVSISGPAWRSVLAHDGIVPLIHPHTTIGAFQLNDIVLSDPAASRAHAAIDWAPPEFEIRDLRSRAGTSVDGKLIDRPTPLTPGQTIRIGSTSLVFQALQVDGSADRAAEGAASIGADGAVANLSREAISRAVQQAEAPVYQRELARHGREIHWRVFLIGLAVFLLSWFLLELTGNQHLVPLVALSASAAVPVAFVVFCWEQGAFVDMPPTILGFAFVSGGTLGLILAATLETATAVAGLLGPIMIGLIEELVKAAAVVWFLRDRRLRSELDGLVLGAAAGMGFAALETAGYGIDAFLKAYRSPPPGSHQILFAHAVQVAGVALGIELIVRMLLALFGHGIWTAIVCAAIWRDRRDRMLRLTWGVVIAFAIAVVLHTIWDSIPILGQLFDAVAGVLLLRFFLHEAVQRTQLPPDTPAPALGSALLHYFGHLFTRHRRPVAQPQAFISAALPGAGGPAPLG